jgi:hypothetical protein
VYNKGLTCIKMHIVANRLVHLILKNIDPNVMVKKKSQRYSSSTLFQKLITRKAKMHQQNEHIKKPTTFSFCRTKQLAPGNSKLKIICLRLNLLQKGNTSTLYIYLHKQHELRLQCTQIRKLLYLQNKYHPFVFTH